MDPTAPARPLTGVERFVEQDEILVSKTDLLGKLTYANGPFIHISGYSERELIGQAHSIVRHPRMPRVIFKLLWSRIQAGEEIFAFVLNRSKNGDEYWVFAHVTPTIQNGKLVGYHSNRRNVNRAALPSVRELYGQLLAEEQRHPGKQEGAAASERLLDDILADRRIGYDEFVWSLESLAYEVAA